MIRSEIKKLIQKALKDLGKSGALSLASLPEIKIDYPSDNKLGDYSTNAAFLLASAENGQPALISKMIAEKIAGFSKSKKMFEKVEGAGAGFVNFTLSAEFLWEYVGNPISHINMGKKKKLNIEFLSANPTGKFQIGNGRIGFYGDVLGNIFTAAGFDVTKEYYINNAKSSNQIQELGKTALGKGDKYLTPYLKEKIKKLGSKLSGTVPDNFAKAGFLLAREIQKDNKKFLEKKANIHFDVWTEEESLYKRGSMEKTLALLKKKDLVYESEGAQWLRTTDFGDDKDKVLVRSSGNYGYYLADIAYHWDKIKRGHKVIIDIFGADHQGHVAPIKIAMQILGFSARGGSASGGKGKFDVLVSQLVQAKGGGKFSKRAGNVILLDSLVDEVGIDTARFFYLMKSLDTQMEFDMDLAKDQSEKNPVYYVQYAHARMASILAKAPNFKKQAPNKLQITNYKLLKHPSELNLVKKLMRWPEVIEDTVNDYQVQRVTSYATELATVFNRFYRDCRVITSDKKLTHARLGLVLASQDVLKSVLVTLGVKAPNKM